MHYYLKYDLGTRICYQDKIYIIHTATIFTNPDDDTLYDVEYQIFQEGLWADESICVLEDDLQSLKK